MKLLLKNLILIILLVVINFPSAGDLNASLKSWGYKIEKVNNIKISFELELYKTTEAKINPLAAPFLNFFIIPKNKTLSFSLKPPFFSDKVYNFNLKLFKVKRKDTLGYYSRFEGYKVITTDRGFKFWMFFFKLTNNSKEVFNDVYKLKEILSKATLYSNKNYIYNCSYVFFNDFESASRLSGNFKIFPQHFINCVLVFITTKKESPFLLFIPATQKIIKF